MPEWHLNSETWVVHPEWKNLEPVDADLAFPHALFSHGDVVGFSLSCGVKFMCFMSQWISFLFLFR